MEAIIMAGGEGSRLRPLTCNMPKPMARLCGKPIVEYILDLLIQHGFDQATLTLGYLPQVIQEHFPKQQYQGLPLRFMQENIPLGTAGGVKHAAQDRLQDDFLVISGDALCNFDLTDFARYHKQSGALITIAVTEVDDPREYGLVNMDERRRVLGFTEKPSWTGVTTNWANTGIYMVHPSVLGMIPDNEPFDFANHLFPKMLAEEMSVQAYQAKEYWCDIGDLDSYRTCQMDLLQGKVQGISVPLFETPEPDLKPPYRTYHVIPPVYIGEDVQIGEHAVIGPNAVIDQGTTVGAYAKIRSGVVLQNGLIGDGTHLTGCVLCDGVGIGQNVSVYEGVVLGSGVTVGDKTEIMPRVSVWPGKTIESGTVVRENVRIGDYKRELFDDNGIAGRVGLTITPEMCTRFGAAIGSMKQVERVGIGYADAPSSKALYYATLSGLCGSGVQVLDLGNVTLAQMYFATAFCDMQAGIYIGEGESSVIKIMGNDGLPATRSMEREIEKILQKGEFVRCNAQQYHAIADMKNFRMLYQQEVYRQMSENLIGIKANPSGEHRESERLFRDAFARMGGVYAEYPVFNLSADGCRVTAVDEEGRVVPYEVLLALGCVIAFRAGEDVALPYDAPYMINRIAKQYHQNCYRYFQLSDERQKEIRDLSRKQYWSRDGMMLAFRIMSEMKRCRKSLTEFVREIPAFAQSATFVPLHQSPSQAMERLKQIADISEQGLRFASGDTVVRIWPAKQGNMLRVLAEAYSVEAASELCEDWQGKIADLLDRNEEV